MKTKTKRRKKTNKKMMALYSVIFLVIVLGIISLANITITGTFKTVAFFKDPMPILIGLEADDYKVSAKREKTAPRKWITVEEYEGRVTAYNAGDPNQCDNTPCISANGENVCTAVALGYGRCATNKYEFGTKLLIDDKFLCTVTDRMNKRYQNGEVDIAMPADQKKEAVAYGAQFHNIKVVK